MKQQRRGYPSDVSDEEWAFAVCYLTLMSEDAPQREHSLREVFNGLRYLVRGGAPWRMIPNDLPPWHVVYQQTQRWLRAGVFEAMVHDLRELLRVGEGRGVQPSAAILDGRTLQGTPESAGHAILLANSVQAANRAKREVRVWASGLPRRCSMARTTLRAAAVAMC